MNIPGQSLLLNMNKATGLALPWDCGVVDIVERGASAGSSCSREMFGRAGCGPLRMRVLPAT
ncbi:hypothetical protein [Streptomyces sp. SLBN-31]|uniref:hypothetical protein n=1 Tax=Streptomyces sp. SLBN-31 TaxID=2768444 RepID=UPI00114EF2B7|nr:hypothetical protein [Streptomyces sp. SLBN-31]